MREGQMLDPDASDARLSLKAWLLIRVLNVVRQRAQTREEIKTARSSPAKEG
jgi:hypothetical protein